MVEFSITDLVWIALLAALALTAAAASLALWGTTWTPLTIFWGVNCLSLAAYHLRLLHLVEVSATVHAIVLIGLVAFGLGCLAVGKVRPCHCGEPPIASWRGLRPFFRVTAILSLIGWVIPLLVLHRKYTLAVLVERPWLLQDEFQMQYVGYLNMLGILVLPCLVLLRLARQGRALDWLFAGSAMLGLLLAGIKQYLFFSVAVAVLVYSVRAPRRIRPAALAILVGLGLVFFVAYQSTIDIFTNRPFQGSRIPDGLRWLEAPYLYLVGSWPALEQVRQGMAGDPPVLGYVVLQPIWKVLSDGLGLMDRLPPYLPFVSIGGGVFNAYSFAGELWWDVGLLGLVAVGSWHGAMSTALFRCSRRSSSWLPALVYGVVVYSLVLSFFAYYLRFQLIILVAYALTVGLACALPRRAVEANPLQARA